MEQLYIVYLDKTTHQKMSHVVFKDIFVGTSEYIRVVNLWIVIPNNISFQVHVRIIILMSRACWNVFRLMENLASANV